MNAEAMPLPYTLTLPSHHITAAYPVLVLIESDIEPVSKTLAIQAYPIGLYGRRFSMFTVVP